MLNEIEDEVKEKFECRSTKKEKKKKKRKKERNNK